MSEKKSLSRRQFLGTGGALACASLMSGSTVRAASRSSSNNTVLPVGFIGVGGMGRTHFNRLSRDPMVRLVAVADPDGLHSADAVRHAESLGQTLGAYVDFREMLSQHPDIAAIFIATPDHWHAKATMECLTAGKDVYCEAPLALTITESRRLVDTARRLNRVLCVGGLQHGTPPAFQQAGAWARSGQIGPLKKAVCFFGPNPQTPALAEAPPPAHLDWEQYLGPAPWRPYHRLIHPYHFRYFTDFSGGVLTEWGVHLFQTAQWGMGKEHSGPLRVEARSTWWENNLYEFPRQAHIRYDYGDVALEWLQEDELELAKRFGPDARYGIQFVGEAGEILVNGTSCVMRGTGSDRDFESLEPHGDTVSDFFDAVRTRTPLTDATEAAHRSSVLALLGNAAVRAQQTLTYDPVKERIV